MTSSAVHLYFLRLTGLLAQGFLLTAGTVLFAFGMLDLFTVVGILALALAWFVLRPASARALAAVQFDEYVVGEHADATGRLTAYTGASRMVLGEFTAPRAFRARARARKALAIPRDRFDIIQAVATTLLWLSYLGFIGTVFASA